MRIFITGDTHGNLRWLAEYIYPTALAVDADVIVQLGDFGYWEHMAQGVEFLDGVQHLGELSQLDLYWLHGNHDKHSLALEKYGDQRDPEGFVIVRDHVRYIPQGHRWSWDETSFRAFGGAYSVDKAYRLQKEQKAYRQLQKQEQGRARAAGRTPKPVASQDGTLWFPEEQMSDEQMIDLLARDPDPVDIVLSHDKPYKAKPPWNRKDFPNCVPNQRRLQDAMDTLSPGVWFHGHLHFAYEQQIGSTTVISLDPDRDAGEIGWRHKQTWAVLDTRGFEGFDVTLGTQMEVDVRKYDDAKQTLY